MQQRSFWVWLSTGLVAAVLGWMGGGLAGSFLPRTVGACALVAAGAGWLAGSPRRALGAGVLAGAVGATAHVLGAQVATALFAWPAASLAIGLAVVGLLRRTRARIGAIVAAPVLGIGGFLLGMVGTGFLGLTLNSGPIASQLLLGGAAAFGAATLAGLHLVARWLDRPLPAAQAPALPGGLS